MQANQRGGLSHVRNGESYHNKGKSTPYKTLREGPWKLIVNGAAHLPEGLYNLNTDPQEQQNLIANPEFERRVTDMIQRYEEILDSDQSTPVYVP